eukprot:jgi/Pico_ML_1/55433/g1118.t2
MARPWRWTLALVGMCWGATWTHATWQGHVGADASELAGWLDELGEVSDAPTPGAVTRLVFTPSDLQARKFVTEKMVEAGMTVRADKIGNLFGRDGVSHRPDEFAAPEDLKRGVETLALTMAKLSVRGYAEEAKEEL